MRRSRFLLTALLALVLSACMTPQALDLREQPPQAVELSAVPFYAQREYQCGPAALAMVMSYLGRAITPDELAPSLYIPDREGTLADELLAQSRMRGFVPERLTPDLRVIAQAVAEGSPVIVFQNNGLSWYPVWHYAVVIGVDAARGKVILRSGEEPRLVMSWSVFDRTWTRSGRWAIRLLPVTAEWPASAALPVVSRQLLAMSRVAPAFALTGVRRALQRWPQEVPLWLALAKVTEQEQGLVSAEAVLREGLLALPEAPWLLNNLADVLTRSGQLSEAITLARRALQQLDRAETRATLAAAEAALAQKKSRH
ncbi:PA2778 family cysteine peptidase [Perlucidibaca aquatica]|uniref:PA2778 family cysteine peptidase n=1 Tax=Perlucidibaca aquatica TaxID=1852776 RepID=UPI00083A7F90|nr:PA2778 family cysteine peptidase [Perlucidibaca aquatica]